MHDHTAAGKGKQTAVQKAERRLQRAQGAVAKAESVLQHLNSELACPGDNESAAYKGLLERRTRTLRQLSKKRKLVRERRSQLKRIRETVADWDRAYRRLSREWDRLATADGPRLATRRYAPISGDQLRGARAMLRLNRRKFAELLEISELELARFERVPGPLKTDRATLSAIRKALRHAGIDLIGPGIYVGAGGFGLRHLDTRAFTKGRLDSPADQRGRGKQKRRRARAL